MTHLTRMRAPYICVAGLDTADDTSVRPIKRYGRLTADDLRTQGGPFAVAEHVDLGAVVDVGAPPEVEDRQFIRASSSGQMGETDYWDLLQRTAPDSLATIFGRDLVADPPGRTIAPGGGAASLGHLRPQSEPRLYLSSGGRLRMLLEDGGDDLNLSVTDLRLYEDDLETPSRDHVGRVTRRIQSGVDVILSVGVGRPYPPDSPRHWLQVNNIHLRDEPTRLI